MSNLQRKILTHSVLMIAIRDVLRLSQHSKILFFGVGCVLSSWAYAEEIAVTHPDTSSIDKAIEKQVAQQQEQQEQQELQQYVQQFATDAVYQLKDEEIPTVDSAMVNNIMAIAQQAQQDAIQQQSQLVPVTPLIPQQDVVSSSIENQQQQIDQFLQQLQAEKLQLPEVQTGNHAATIDTHDHHLIKKIKSNFFTRWWNRHDEEAEQVAIIPKIQVTVDGVQGELADNIKAKLSTFTVDAFEDYSVALPQIKTLTTQAAQAVGYYQANFHYAKENETKLAIAVKPYEPVLVKSQQIEFTGQGAKRPAFLVVKAVPDLNQDDVFVHNLYETTKSRIHSAASNQGYFDAYWRMHDVKVTLPENTADIQLKYETGERYKLRDVEFKMSDESKPFPLRRSVLEKLVPFQGGDDYMDWRITGLSNNLTNSRYFNYSLVDVIKPDPIEHPLEVPEDVQHLLAQQKQATPTPTMTDEEQAAQQVIVDETVFAGAEEQRPQLARVAEDMKANAALQETERLKQQAREEKKIPVRVTLNADKLNNLETGVGYGTDSGVRLRTQYRRSIVNDRGHSFDANMELSQKRQAVDGRYMIPYKHPLEDYMSLIGGYEREVRGEVGQGIELDIESAVMGAERTMKRPLGEWQHNMSVRYRLDRITTQGHIDEQDIPNAFKVVSHTPEQESLLFGYEISRTQQDNLVNPTRGFRQFYRTEVGSQSLWTETDMAILSAGWRFIYSLGDNADHQFVGRADTGYIVSDNFNQVPYNLRYFAGGDQSIRGYDYKSLSPTEQGVLIGGQALAVGSLEYNYQFKQGWRAAIFADVGNAYDDKFSTPTKYGAGLGVRWASPVGPIRIDVAAGIDETSIPIRLHFFIGPPL